MRVPPAIQLPFAGAAIAGLASFAFFGFVTALTGDVLTASLQQMSHLVAGLVVSAMYVASASAQLYVRRLSSRSATLLGLAALPAAGGSLVGAVHASSLPLLLAAAVVGGTGAGFAFRCGLATVTGIAPPALRGEVVSVFYAIS